MLLLTVGPAHAQRAQASETSGHTAAIASDKSGASVTNSESIFFQSDEAQIRMNDVASTLLQALRRGHFGSSVVRSPQPIPVSPMMANLLAASSRRDVSAARRHFTRALTTANLPLEESEALAQAAAGLLNEGTASALQVQEALNAYNAAVDTAPANFLVEPPQEFILVRAVLVALLEGAV